MPHFCPQNSPFVAVAGVLLTAFACVTARHKNRAKPYRLALLLSPVAYSLKPQSFRA